MKIAMLRVGIDSGTGGIQGPLFQDGSFEYLPIMGRRNKYTYGNTLGTHGSPLSKFFPINKQKSIAKKYLHNDPEFETFTYGDPTSPKRGLRNLESGDMLIFYCGLQGWDFESKPALYLIGYFIIQEADYAWNLIYKLGLEKFHTLFAKNFHVRVFNQWINDNPSLILVKGNSYSRFLSKAILLSTEGHDITGHLLKVISPNMQQIFGNFNGKISFQRSPTRWVNLAYVNKAAKFMKTLQ